MELEITNRTKEKIPLGEIRKTLKKIAKIIKLPREAVISIVFLDSKSMRELNKKYRRKDEATDVLAFLFTKSSKQKNFFTIPDFIRGTFGEIFLCPEKMRDKAALRNMAPEEYRKLLFVHALLHLQGMEHKKKGEAEEMERVEQRVFEKLARPAREIK